MAKQFTLGKNERLKSRKQIEQLFSEGESFASSPFRVHYKMGNGQLSIVKCLRFGAGVSGKNFKKAVDRNRIKRVTREAYRLQKKELGEKLRERDMSLNLFFIYTAKELPDYKQVFASVEKIFKKLIRLVDENRVANS